jgi:hypothetical protein
MTDLATQRRLYFARFCWQNRDELCENEIMVRGKLRRPTWGELFELREGMTLDEFERRQRAA